jgi:hypothetical protein
VDGLPCLVSQQLGNIEIVAEHRIVWQSYGDGHVALNGCHARPTTRQGGCGWRYEWPQGQRTRHSSVQ